MADANPNQPTYQSPFERAAIEAAKARAAAAAKAAPSVAKKPAAHAPVAAGRAAFGGGTQTDARAPFLATEATQQLKAQQARMERARIDAERQRQHLEVERLKSHIFIKKQEFNRVATRLRAAESALVAAESEERRATSSLGASAGAIHEKATGREHVAAERDNSDRDFERREVAEHKAIEILQRDMDKMAKGGLGKNSPQYLDLERRRRDREKGLSSIKLERSRRRNELLAKDASLGRQMAGAERAELMAERAATLAGSLVSKYRLQVRTFSVAKAALESDLERMNHDLAMAEAVVRRTEISSPASGVGEPTFRA